MDLAEKRRILSLQPMAGNAAEQVVVVESGEILKRDGTKIELIGQIKEGILVASWSPAVDLLALVSGAGQLIVMTADFEVVHEGPVEGDGSAECSFVSVGWGRKETQFHGSAGKAAAQAVKSVVMRPVPGDAGIPRIAWRGDGAFFAVSSAEAQASGARRIRVFDRLGGLQGVSEPEEQLEGSLAWIPNGALIASTAIQANGARQVVFFERNGLRHGEFTLPTRLAGVKELAWSPDSSVLAILFGDGVVGLWSQRNYHWYEKARLPGLDACSLAWNPASKEHQLAIVSSADVLMLDISWAVSRSRGDASDALSLVAVVDGPKLLLTPFAVANVPPPMSFAELEVPGGHAVPVAVDVITIPGKPSFLLALATHDSLCVFEGGLEDRTLRLARTTQIPIEGLEQVVFESPDRLVIKKNDEVLRVRSPQSLDLLDELTIDRAFVISSCGTVLQSYPGEFRRVGEAGWTPAPGGFSPVFFDSPAGIVGLSETGSLAVDGEPVPLCSACTSLHLLAPDFLVIGGVEKSLRFLPLSQPPSAWCQDSSGEEAVRRIEAGAEIVCASSAACSLVLQAPRGNLETIYPRAMVLAGIRKALGRLDYRRAYLDCRRHRIDLNFLHDAQPIAFMATVDRFVAQVREPDYLNLFLSSLSPEDCTRTKYPGFGSAEREEEEGEQGSGDDKVNRICEAIRNAIDQSLVEPVMTSYVCQRPPQPEAALRSLLRLSESDADPEAMERALTYLVWLVDPSKLYDVALGLYHLPLALSIGRRSQKDPAEYVGFLEEMAALPEAMQRFRIDDRLGRDELALTSLWRCVQEGLMEEADLLGYIEAKPQLYKPALSLPGMPTELNRRLLVQFAGHCQTTGALDAAAALFRRAKDYASAFEGCVEAGLWQEALAIANEVGMEEGEDRLGLVGDLFERLMRSSRYPEAYALTVGCDVDMALEAALAGHLWLEAARLPVSVHDRVLPKAVEVAEGLLTDLGDLQKTFGEQSTRLLFLLRRLIEPPKSSSIAGSVAEISDTLSEMSFHSTASTRLTRSSTASSSRSKKKTERAKLRTKPGSPYERDGLRVALEQLLAKVNQIQAGIRPLLLLLSTDVGSTPLASKLQSMLMEVISQMAAFSTSFRDLHFRLVAKMLAQANGPVTIGGPETTGDAYYEEIANRHAWQTAFQLPPGFEVTANWSLPFL